MATPASVYCAEKWRLLMLFMQAAAAYLRLETAQIQAVIAEAEEPECSDLEIEEARQRKNEAKQAIFDHLESHEFGPVL